VFTLLMAASATLLLGLRSRLGFFLDDWALVVGRVGGGVGDFLEPHNEHIIVLPALIYRASLELFGMEAMPLQVVCVALFLLSVALLFAWISEELGDAAAAIGCSVVLFLGVAYEDLLWAFQMGYFGSVAAGLGGLLLTRRGDRRGDVLACACLTAAILFSSVGIPFVAGAVAALALDARRPGSRSRLLRRAWVAAVPTATYLAWWIGWGRTAENSASLENLLHAPIEVVSFFGLAIADLTGLYNLIDRTSMASDVYPVIGLVAIAGLAFLFRRRGRVPDAFLVAAAAALVFWGLAALNATPERQFTSSRYQFPGAVLTLMMLSAAFTGMRPGRVLTTAAAVVAAFAILVNVNTLMDGYRDVFKPYYERGIAAATAFQISSETVNPSAAVGVNYGDTALLQAGAYLSAVERYGGGAGWSEGELRTGNIGALDRLDEVLTRTLPVTGEQVPSARWRDALGDRCETTRSTGDGSPPIELPAGKILVLPERNVAILASRFAEGTTQTVGIGAAGKVTEMDFPLDRSKRRWRISFTGPPGKVGICAAVSAPSS
jgi:hypothetical protein